MSSNLVGYNLAYFKNKLYELSMNSVVQKKFILKFLIELSLDIG